MKIGVNAPCANKISGQRYPGRTVFWGVWILGEQTANFQLRAAFKIVAARLAARGAFKIVEASIEAKS